MNKSFTRLPSTNNKTPENRPSQWTLSDTPGLLHLIIITYFYCIYYTFCEPQLLTSILIVKCKKTASPGISITRFPSISFPFHIIIDTKWTDLTVRNSIKTRITFQAGNPLLYYQKKEFDKNTNFLMHCRRGHQLLNTIRTAGLMALPMFLAMYQGLLFNNSFYPFK